MSEPANEPVIADLKAHRNGRKDDRTQLLQHLAILKLFWQYHGRRELSEAELQSWIARQGLNADFDPFAVLTAEEIAAHDQHLRERDAETATVDRGDESLEGSEVTSDLHAQRNGRDLTRYNLLQGAALLKLFRQARGREPLTDTEFREWIDAQTLPSPLDPYAILTPDEINEIDQRKE